MNELILKSNAKINIGLDILYKRDDDYHEIRSIFQEIDWGDDIKISKVQKGIQFSCNIQELENPDNLCVIAAKKLLKGNSPGVKISLKKNIPAGTGLGGGSSNAATVLKGINELYQMDFSIEHLHKIAAEIGSDVPFFLYGKTAHISGRGEVIEPIKNKGYLKHVLIILPDIHLSTKLMYAKLKKILTKEKKSLIIYGSFAEEILQSGMIGLKNDFEEIAMQMHPELKDIKSGILNSGCSVSMMTGSGSAFFGLSRNRVVEDDVLKKYRIIHTKFVN